ncbi:MAG: S-layer homology domain-containing protein [Anaerovoracaceae bacterium]|nr:S-layer homology domain-containing protein [Bacillota bacterium]MDY2671391.1 S-layer homology domain-containing protein [Anaerovoracaceae bacterium]
MIRKRLLALALAAALAGSVQAVPVFAVQKAGSGFSDMPTGWSHDAVVYAVEHGYMSGYDGKINPRGYLTRAEMASMMNRAFGNTEKGSLDGYTDVPENAWYRDDMAKAVAKGIFSGYDGKLEPEKNITRE